MRGRRGNRPGVGFEPAKDSNPGGRPADPTSWLRNAERTPTLSQPMSRMHLNAYLVPAALKAAGTSRCLWIGQERPTFDPRSGV
jgi:hypothetical protein